MPDAIPAPSTPLAARESLIGLSCAFGVTLVWAGFLLASRLSTQQPFTPWDVAALRYSGAFLVGLVLVARFGWPRLPFRRSLALLAGAAFGFPFASYIGFGFAPTSHGAVLMTGLLPFVTTGLATLFMGERWDARKLLSLSVVGLGIGLLATDTFGAHPGAWRGDLIFLIGCFSWASFTLLIRYWRVPAMTATLVLALYPAPLYLPVWWLFLPSRMAEAPLGVLSFQLVYHGLMAVVVAGFLFSRAVNLLGPARTTTITALAPALAALLAWPLLGEPLGMAGLAGVALVSAGMVLGVARR
ncbi:DMT family transporter [Roseomonas marmotae]|uniref:DMT family transporter n=1 Tax=Roseomonas marmotae TaxID=2768161 RepID=A0ABS3KG76_9PROT|nr:DMT family transporter [Roseomonas marmotae]MBO1076478.1 DMT family transporter [Roseomonas marmotae]QTI77922.1 DMT family transporter [Roseomonas marmotae]